MENQKSLTINKFISIKEEKLFQQVNFGRLGETHKNKLHLDLDILLQNNRAVYSPCKQYSPSQRVRVSIKSRKPAIKTLFIAEKSRYRSKKSSQKFGSRSRLGIGDHSSLCVNNSSRKKQACNKIHIHQDTTESQVDSVQIPSSSDSKLISSKCWNVDEISRKPDTFHAYCTKRITDEKCCSYTRPQFTLNPPKEVPPEDKAKTGNKKLDTKTFISTKSATEKDIPANYSDIQGIFKRLDSLERKFERQEMVLQSLDPHLQLSSSDEECKDMCSSGAQPGCSYVQQYSLVPDTSAFQRCAHRPLPCNSALQQGRNSEQYGREFTTYDGLTVRGRRTTASMPSKRDELPKVAADRTHKIRHKLNPVRDYRLMDTVHYLAQGEFAPRDDGIKLTPSREAVLSDIIWEDVCRTHWPSARLGRRTQHERSGAGVRSELQHLIDNLLRERVAHVERRRRRHYRVVKLSQRHESCRLLGKTGDIIVASQKKQDGNKERELPISDHNTATATIADHHKRETRIPKKEHKSHDRFVYRDMEKHQRRLREECSPLSGPSYDCQGPQGCLPSTSRAFAGCHHSTSPQRTAPPPPSRTSHCSRIIIKKEPSRPHRHREKPDLEPYIVLPTLVIRTPSNVKRQKKFNELYHRILKTQVIDNKEDHAAETNSLPAKRQGATTKDIGLNVNIAHSSSEEDIKPTSTMHL